MENMDKMSADKSAENTPNAPKFICPICLDFNEKRLHFIGRPQSVAWLVGNTFLVCGGGKYYSEVVVCKAYLKQEEKLPVKIWGLYLLCKWGSLFFFESFPIKTRAFFCTICSATSSYRKWWRLNKKTPFNIGISDYSFEKTNFL